ncbi:hypothetical protein AB0K93_26750, partial [Streptomyces sp. NPDC052676]
MLDATTHSGGTATASPRATALAGPSDLAVAVPARAGFPARCARLLLSPWSRFALLVALLAGAAS